MKSKHIIPALLTMAGLAFGSQAYGLTAAVPDLAVGFQQVGGSNDYQVDLGSMANYVNLAPNTLINLSGTVSASDLSSLFTSSWATSSNVTWGGAATVGASAATLNGESETAKTTWITQFDGISKGLAPSLTPPASIYTNKAALSGGNTRYQAVQNLYLSYGSGTALSTPNAVEVSTSTAGSYTKYSSNNGFAAGFDGPTALNLGAGQYSVIDLFKYTATPSTGPGTYVGSLELSNTGGLFFTNYVPTVATAIPEPTTYAALIGVAALGFAMIRRRKQATV